MGNAVNIFGKEGNQASVDANGAVATATTTNDILPIDIQSHYAQTIQTHNAVSIGATNGTSDSVYIDTDGFDKIAVSYKNDASVSSYADLHWSHDGVNRLGIESILTSSTMSERVAVTDTKARYVRFRLCNQDAVAHTMSGYIYLKA